jgi:hypothetical protein
MRFDTLESKTLGTRPGPWEQDLFDPTFSSLKVSIPHDEDESIASETSPVLEYDDSLLKKRFRDLWEAARLYALQEVPLVAAVPLAEALKVRVITKGPPLLGFVLKHLQLYLWGVLAKHPCFSLISEPVSERYIQDRMGKRGCGEDEFFVSGDYQASTDNLHRFVSEVIVDELIIQCQIPGDLGQLFRTALTRHLIERYVVRRGRVISQFALTEGQDVGSKMQKSGQLMGSVVSFPVLCIANAALCRLAMEIGSQRRWSLADARLIINGDDCLFRTNRLGYDMWRKIGEFFGLQESVGKTFLSRHYLNVNSTGFLYESPGRTDYVTTKDGRLALSPLYFRRLPVINWGLIVGQKRSQAGLMGVSEVEMGADLGDRFRDLLTHCLPSVRGAVAKKFLNRHWSRLKVWNLPWYLPRYLGGIGLLPGRYFDLDFGPSQIDLRASGYVLGHLSEIVTASAAPTWKIRQLMGTLVPVPRGPVQESSLAFEQALALEVFFRYRLEDLLDDSPSDKLKQSLRRNETVWSHALRHTGEYSPCSENELWNRAEPKMGWQATCVTSLFDHVGERT